MAQLYQRNLNVIDSPYNWTLWLNALIIRWRGRTNVTLKEADDLLGITKKFWFRLREIYINNKKKSKKNNNM